MNIGDANLSLSKGEDEGNKFKELIVSYKSESINTYNVIVFDLS